MSLYTEQFGTGDDLVLIHGWGLHSGVWAPVLNQLSQHYRVTTVDLPGHGHSPLPAGGFDIMRLSQLILNSVPTNAIWVGWSLGGMAALNAALHYPAQIRKVVMVGAQVQFVQSTDWPAATPVKNLQTFTDNLTQDTEGTLKRFLGLQVRGADDEKSLLKLIRQLVAERPLPNPEALRLGLAILKEANLRPQLHKLQTPTQLILGARDMLTPVACADLMRPLMPSAQFDIMPTAGHAPFLSHPTEFLSCLNAFLNK